MLPWHWRYPFAQIVALVQQRQPTDLGQCVAEDITKVQRGRVPTTIGLTIWSAMRSTLECAYKHRHYTSTWVVCQLASA
jgi:hypothetical protein